MHACAGYRFGTLLALAPLFVAYVPASAVSYSVKGQLSYELQKPSGKNPALLWAFRLVVEDCKWKISVSEASESERRPYVYQYDGTNLSYLAFAQSAANGDSGMVEDSEVPQMWLSTAGEFAWLALASSCYFAKATNGTARSLFALRSNSGRVRRYEVPVVIKLDKLPPCLPKSVRYITDRFLLLKEDGSLETSSIASKFPSLGDAFTSGEFSSHNFTNVGGLSLPTAFEYRDYLPISDGTGSAELRLVLVVRGTVSEVEANAAAIDLSLGSRRIYIQDLRVQTPQTLVAVTNGALPQTNTPSVLRAQKKAERVLKHAAARQAYNDEGTTARRRIVVAAIVISSIAFGLLLVAGARRARQ